MQGPADVLVGCLEQVGADELVEDVLARCFEEKVDEAGAKILICDCPVVVVVVAGHE